MKENEIAEWAKYIADYKALLARQVCLFCRSGIHHSQLQGGPMTATCKYDCVS